MSRGCPRSHRAKRLESTNLIQPSSSSPRSIDGGPFREPIAYTSPSARYGLTTPVDLTRILASVRWHAQHCDSLQNRFRCVRWHITYRLSYRELMAMVVERRVTAAAVRSCDGSLGTCRSMKSAGTDFPDASNFLRRRDRSPLRRVPRRKSSRQIVEMKLRNPRFGYQCIVDQTRTCIWRADR